MISPDRQVRIRQLFDDYIEMYAARDDRLTGRFSDNFSGYAGSSEVLVKDREAWVKVTRQDFTQVPQRVRIEMLDIALQDLSREVVLVTAFFHIHLPIADEVLAREVARLVLVFRQEDDDWKIVHSGISVPYAQAHDGEVYPLRSLEERNSTLEALVQERTHELEESQALYRLLTEDTLDVLWKADRNLVITYVSPSDERLRGFKSQEVVGHHVFEMFTPEGVGLVQKLMAAKPEIAVDGTPLGFVTFEVQHRCKDGRLLWAEVLSRPERDVQGNLIGFHGISRETTQRHQLEDQIRKLAFYDALTQLPNRRLLMDRLAQAMASSQRSGLFGAVLFLDLDNFKALNDTHGHAAGDALLIEVANRLRAGVRNMDTVARLGGDEFVVMFREFDKELAASQLQAGAVAEKIRASLAQPYCVEVRGADASVAMVEHHCTASIGVALFSGQAQSHDEVCKFADAAMYQAKDAGRNQVRFHTAPVTERADG